MGIISNFLNRRKEKKEAKKKGNYQLNSRTSHRDHELDAVFSHQVILDSTRNGMSESSEKTNRKNDLMDDRYSTPVSDNSHYRSAAYDSSCSSRSSSLSSSSPNSCGDGGGGGGCGGGGGD